MESFVITGIVLAHQFVAPKGWRYEEHAQTRRCHGIVYVLRGSAEYRMQDGKTFTAGAGDCLYIPEGTGYVVRCGDDEGFDHMTVNFTLEGTLLPERRTVRFASPSQPEQTFRALVRTWSLRHDFFRERCMGLLYEMTYLLLQEASVGSHRHGGVLEPARAYLDEHFAKPVSISVLPSLCGLSPTYFHRLFIAVYHETPGDYLRRLRVARACDLLLDGVCGVAQAAALCGYDDAAYFSRVFKKTTGESPAQYVRAHRG